MARRADRGDFAMLVERDIEVEADRVVEAVAVVVGFNGGVGGAVGEGKLYLGVRDGDCGSSGM